MATYQQLVGSSFTDVVVPFTSDNGLGVIDTCTNQLTGYSLPITKFTFTATLTSLENTYIGASMDKLIWDFDDGTYSTGVSVTKHYEYPGIYNVTCIFTDQNGVTHKNRLTQEVKVSNYIPDSLVWYTPTIADPNGGRPEKCFSGLPSNDLTIYRMNSWQSWPVVSGDGGYFINLYATGSKSKPLSEKQYWEMADSHLTPNWRFIASKDSTVPLERVQTDNDYIYVAKRGTDLVRVPSTEVDAVFAGTSGQTIVYYVDDNPNRLTSARDTEASDNVAAATFANENLSSDEFNLTLTKTEDKDIILYASFDTSKFPVTYLDSEMPKFELLKENYFQIYETQKVGLPIQVKFNYARELHISSTGIRKGFEINGNKFVDSPMAMCVRTQDFSGNIVISDEVVPLSSRWTAPTTAFSAGDVTTDVLTAQGFVSLYLSGSDSTFTRVKSPFASEEDFKIWDIGQLVPEKEENKFVRVVCADRDGTLRPDINGKTVKLLFSELVEEQQKELIAMGPSAFSYKIGDARDWTTKNGSQYYGYVAPKSNYADATTVNMELTDVTESFSTPGSYLLFANLTVSDTLVLDPDKKYRYYAHTLVKPPLTFGTDVTYYYITNPTNDWFWQIKPTYYRTYSYGDDGLTQTYTAPISTVTPGNSGMYGMAVDPLGDVIAVDGDTDKIIRYWRNRSLRTEKPIRDLLPESTRQLHYPDNESAYGYTPSSVALDKKGDYWVTLYDTVSTIKLDGETDEIIATAIAPDRNYLAHVRTSYTERGLDESVYQMNEVNGRPGEYGENLIQPTTVDTCTNNDIVVAYTNPLCSFIARYSPEGEFLYKWEFTGEDRYFTGDIVVDVSDHVWAVTESTGLNYDGSVSEECWSAIYSFDEELTLRLVVSSLEGTEYQDMLKPTPHKNEQVTILVNMDQEYDFEKQKYYETGLLIDGYGNEKNPQITLFEGDTYHFENQYFNNGQHPLKFQEMTEDNLTLPLSTDPILFDTSGDLLTELVSGYDTPVCSITVSSTTPDRFLLVDQNYPNTQTLVLNVIKKPVINSRQAETFSKINNAGFIVPDNNNHIWFSWGRRFCSRYNHLEKRVDTTVAVGSAFDDDYYDVEDPETYDRRNNDGGRRSAIEGLAMDTANNLLVVNNHDKVLYAINSDQPTLSAYINIHTYQQPYSAFEWIDGLSANNVTQDDFMLYPDSYMTKEQISAFLRNVHFTGTEEQKMAAYQSYMSEPDMFRHAHGSYPISAVGLEEEICAYGDWTGYRWINKYDDRPVATDEQTGFVSITGSSDEFSLQPQTSTYEIAKINEDVDFAGVLRQYMQQPILRDNSIIYNDLMDAIFGTQHSTVDSIGKRIYERISNYVTNHTDIDTCTVRALYGMAEMVGYKMLDLGYTMPVEIQRLIDLFSINYNRLRGLEYFDQTDFEKYGNWDQDRVGVNLGNEFLFIFDYDPTRSYGTGDYVFYAGEYWEAKKSMGPGSNPLEDRDLWLHWPDGQVRSRSLERLSILYPAIAGSAELEEMYYKQNVRIQLTQNLQINVDEKYVVREEFSGEYKIVNPVAISVEDKRDFNMKLVDDYLEITNANYRVRLDHEHIATNTEQEPIYTFDDDVITIFGRPVTNSSTILLFRNRTYKFNVDSIGHPIIITTTPGPSAEPVGDYVSGQLTEYGKIVIKTDDHPIYGPIPDKLYYQSANDPKISGTFVIKYVEEVPGYDPDFDGLKSYNLNISVSSHEELDRLGWGLSFPDDGNAWQYYSIYKYIPDGNKTGVYVNNIIDWSSNNTTIDPSILQNNAIEKWSGENGLMETMIDKTLRSGLRLMSGVNSITESK